MYAEKCHQKCWHDNNVCTKKFQNGDLVLIISVKKHKQQLTMHGMGPCVIHEIMSRGVV